MPRLDPREPPYESDIAERLSRIMPPGVPPLTLFRTVAHNPRVLRRMLDGGLLDRGSVGLMERELMILRTCARCGAEYEWGVHVRFFAERAELSPAQVAATVLGGAEDAAWNPAQASIVALADALHDGATVADELWARLARLWTPEQLIELVMLAGLYHAVSFLANALALAPEPYAARFPRQSAAAGAPAGGCAR